MLLLLLISAVTSFDGLQIYRDFITNPWLSNSYDPSVAAFLHVLSGAAYERSSNRRTTCLHPLQIASTNTKILGDLVEGHVGYHSGGRGTIVVFFPGTHDSVQLFHEWLKSNPVGFLGLPNLQVLKYFLQAVDQMWNFIFSRVQIYLRNC